MTLDAWKLACTLLSKCPVVTKSQNNFINFLDPHSNPLVEPISFKMSPGQNCVRCEWTVWEWCHTHNLSLLLWIETELMEIGVIWPPKLEFWSWTVKKKIECRQIQGTPCVKISKLYLPWFRSSIQSSNGIYVTSLKRLVWLRNFVCTFPSHPLVWIHTVVALVTRSKFDHVWAVGPN